MVMNIFTVFLFVPASEIFFESQSFEVVFEQLIQSQAN